MGGRYCAINSPLGPRWGQKSLDLRSRDFCPHLEPRGELITQYWPPMSFRYIILPAWNNIFWFTYFQSFSRWRCLLGLLALQGHQLPGVIKPFSVTKKDSKYLYHAVMRNIRLCLHTLYFLNKIQHVTLKANGSIFPTTHWTLCDTTIGSWLDTASFDPAIP